MEATTVGTTISVMPYYTDVTFSDVRANGASPRLVAGQGVSMVDPQSKVVVVHTAVQGMAGDPLRGEQFAFFFGVINSLKQSP